MIHIPVLQKEVLRYLNPKQNENFVDATIGEGGYTTIILERDKPRGRVLGIEIDSEQIKNCEEKLKKFKNRIILVQNSYTNLREIVKENNFQPINGILFDLGMSSWHLEKSGRGFSFLRNEPLDMRFRTTENVLTAERIVNEWPKEELIRIFQEYGDERFSARIAKKIYEERKEKPIKTTFQLVEIIRKAVPLSCQHKKIHLATRVFQALRITVNDELNNLKEVLPQAVEILAEKGRIVIISFHSLEDRIVKNFFKNEEEKKILKILTKKPIKAGLEEIKNNPRSRSAKLRSAIKN